MCRVISYLGKSILIDELFYKPDNSLVTQSYHPRQMSHILNLAGFGFSAWDNKLPNPKNPLIYKTYSLPFYDNNLKNISKKLYSNCLIAHVRGISYSEKNVVSNQNVHPFCFDNTNIAFAHNGSLIGFEDMRSDIYQRISNKYKKYIYGTTDSEFMYALFLSQLKNQSNPTVTDIFSALIDTLIILRKIRRKNNIAISSPLNFFISNGDFIVATRFVFDYGYYPTSEHTSPHMEYHSLWYTYGEEYTFYNGMYQMKASKKMRSIIIASEPLTEDSTTWIEVPEYSFIGATLRNQQLKIQSLDVMV